MHGIDEVLADTSLLPLEFKWLGIVPQHWTLDGNLDN